VIVDHEKLVEFMEDIAPGKLYDKKEQHQKLNELYPVYSKLHQKTFTSRAKLYAKLEGLKYGEKVIRC
jgi:hypothetical protein